MAYCIHQTACIQDLHTLKLRYPKALIKHTDITPHINQNCDATCRVLTDKTVQELATYVPEARGTQLYLKASYWVHAPFRNSSFGSPPTIVRSLWAGLMTWRRMRCYIQVIEGLTLSINFISYSHYLTLELLVHAGINHQLALYYAFPHLVIKDYGMRHTGNRGLEAINGIFRGGSASLPITAPNLIFQEFLSKMNKTNQIHRAEQNLKLIEGHTIVASNNKRKTSARHSSEAVSATLNEYIKPKLYSEYIQQLSEACMQTW